MGSRRLMLKGFGCAGAWEERGFPGPGFAEPGFQGARPPDCVGWLYDRGVAGVTSKTSFRLTN